MEINNETVRWKTITRRLGGKNNETVRWRKKITSRLVGKKITSRLGRNINETFRWKKIATPLGREK